MRIYIATRYADGSQMERIVKPALTAAGHQVVSSWHETESESDANLTDDDVITAFARNRAELEDLAEAVLLIASPGARETYAEGEAAFATGHPVVWLGHPHLSARFWALRGSCFLVKDLEEALTTLASLSAER